MAEQWFYSKAGNEFGPVTANFLRQLARAGELRPTDRVTREGTGRWVEASRVKGLFPATWQPATQTTSLPRADDQYALEVVALPAGARIATDEPEGEGKLEIDSACRFFLTHPLGMPAWVVGSALGTFLFLLLMYEKDRDSRSPMPEVVFPFLAGFFMLACLGAYVALRVTLGKQTACPRCDRRFSKLLVGSDARVVDSRGETRTYTGQAAIRDRHFRVTGYVDEQRTMPVTVKTVVGVRRYRCKSCGHRWEVSDVGNVIM